MKKLKILGFGQRLSEKGEEAPAPPRSDAVYAFDSGACLTMNDLYSHLLGMGITGAGKTMAVGAPLLKGALGTGCAALIADHKGNLRKIARKICKMVGREQDIIEYGTGPLALPANLIEGLPIYQIRALFSALMRRVFEGKSRNLDFHEKGVNICVDVVSLLRMLHDMRPDHFPRANLALLSEIILDETGAMNLYQLFKKNFYADSNPDMRAFCQKVESNPFHILTRGKNQASSSSRAEQLAYALNLMKLALTRFLEVPELVRSFAADAEGIDFSRALGERKIVLFRLDPGIGPVGEDLCRVFIEAWYSAIIQRGAENAIPSLTFLDEFQSICDLGRGRYSDSRFVAEAREFKAAVSIFTQNVAGLPEIGRDSLLHNLNTKIMLYNMDPLAALSIAGHSEDGLEGLTSLERGEAFVVRYDSGTGKHIAGRESCNMAHDRVKAALEAISDDEIEAEPLPRTPRRLLTDILASFDPSAPRAPVRKPEPKEKSKAARKPGAPLRLSPELSIVREIMEKEGWAAATQSINDLIYNYPDFFIKDAEIALPAGWLPHLGRILDSIAASGLSMRLSTIDMETARGETFKIEFAEGSGAAQLLFRALVRKMCNFCVICGKKHGSREELMRICGDCQKRFGLDSDAESNDNRRILTRDY